MADAGAGLALGHVAALVAAGVVAVPVSEDEAPPQAWIDKEERA